MQTLEQLRDRLAQLTNASKSILETADSEGRPLSADELAEVERNSEEYDTVLADVQMRERVQAQIENAAVPQPRQTAPANNPRQNTARNFPQPKQVLNGKHNFGSLGEFLQCVRVAQIAPSRADGRLSQAAASTDTFSSEGTPSDGGYALPPDFRATILEKIGAEGSLLGMTDQITTGSNSVTFPIDETAPWGTDGLQARWESEGNLKLESKVALDTSSVKLNKIAAVVPVSDELLEDVPALDGYIKRRLPEKIDYKVSEKILFGTGVGEPLGLMKGTDLIKVDPGSTPSGSIQFPSIAEMYSRMYAPSRSRAVWLVNPEIEYKLMLMAFMQATSATLPTPPVPVYLPAGSIAGAPYGTLLGRPVIPTMACAAAGTEGDIIFADMQSYLSLVKATGLRQDVSIHAYFVQDLTAYRFVLRIGGKPWWKGVVTPPNGTFTQAHFVTLDDR